MPNILVLGDCASAGTNVLTQEITGEKDALVGRSLPWNETDIKRWYLERRTKNNRVKISDLLLVKLHAVEYLAEQELINSYWKYISHSQPIENMSKNGATAYEYYKMLKKYEKKYNRRPDIIFVSDYAVRHNWQRVNHTGHKFFFEKRYGQRRPEFSAKPHLTAPVEVQRITHDKAKLYHHKGVVEKRSKKIMSWFINYLTKNNYQFHKIRFYDRFKEFDNNVDVVDCLDLQRKYNNGSGDRVDVKVEVAPLIAQRIVEKFPWLTLEMFDGEAGYQ